jgi:hypothetical protein
MNIQIPDRDQHPCVDYSGDDYPRLGCILTVDVSKNGYSLRVYSPSGRMLEAYALVKTPEQIAHMVRQWCSEEVPTPNTQPLS